MKGREFRNGKRAINALVLCFCGLVLSGRTDTFLWANRWDSRSTQFYPFDANANWTVTDGDGAAVSPHADFPGPSDDIDYGPGTDGDFMHFDLQGKTNIVNGIANGTPGSSWSAHIFRVKNGSLRFRGDVTNKLGEFYAEEDGEIVFAAESTGAFGVQAASSKFIVRRGGRLEVFGSYVADNMRLTVEEGGSCVFNPLSFSGTSWSFTGENHLLVTNGGELELPAGFAVRGTSASNWSGHAHVYQNAGTLTLGGDIALESENSKFTFHLSGGRIHVTDDVAIKTTNWRPITAEMPANATATIEVDEGKTFDVSVMTFGANTTIVKRGRGAIRFGASKPTTLRIGVGSFYEAAANESLRSWLQFENDSELVLNGLGVSAESLVGLENASVAIRVAVGPTERAFLSTNAALCATVAAKLAASVPVEQGYYSACDGGVIYEVAHDSVAFHWRKPNYDAISSGDMDALAGWSSTYYDFADSGSWSTNGAWGANEGRWLPCAGDDFRIVKGQWALVSIDMNGMSRSFRHYDATDYAEDWAYKGFCITNGTFGFTGSFTNTRAVVKAEHGGTFMLGADCVSRMGLGIAASTVIAKDGGTVDLGGSIELAGIHGRVYEGGTMILEPHGGILLNSDFNADLSRSYLENFGTLAFPVGLDFVGSGGNAPGVFRIVQNGGTLSFGGSFSCDDPASGVFTLELLGGTLKATGDADLTGMTAMTLPDGKSVVVDVQEGKTLNLSTLSNGVSTAIAKTGLGTLWLGELPCMVDAQAGTLGISRTVDLGSSLSLSANATLAIAAPDCHISSVAADPSARVVLADGFPSRRSILVSESAAVLEAVRSLLDPPAEGCEYAIVPAGAGYCLKMMRVGFVLTVR